MTLIIAEAGVNHNGDIKIAFKLIEEAANAGADIIKFQTFEANRLVTDSAKKAKYQLANTSKKESHYEMIKKLELKKDDHFKLIEHCKKNNIEFFTSAFDTESLAFISSLELSRYKVPSGEITNLPYLKQMGSYNKPIILSTGMSDIQDIKNAIDALEHSGTSRSKITVLHCSTEYPAPINEVNLMAMLSIKKEFNVDVGYSDHTAGIEVSIAAVALGAKVIEKHITLDKNLSGPDHLASTEPEEFKKMVTSIRNIEKALGDGVKKPTKLEKDNMLIARKSIVASKNIKKGDIFSYNNLTVKRPGNGISPMYLDSLVGKLASKSFKENEIITAEY
jgi:N,N'-diacetyllegionaminate synthase